MSQAPHETIDVPNEEKVGDDQYPPGPQLNQNQALPSVSGFVDESRPIFSMYLEKATEHDKKMAEDWKADADGILIFTGLFSAAVATLISVSIQDIQQNPQDISNFYLANTYHATINPNLSSSLPASPLPFSPPNYAIWVNALWFLSLAISLTCALLATFLQQWARRYIRVTSSRYSLHKRARIRAFFSEGVEKLLLPSAVETLPILIHISLSLFFAGLVIFLWNVNLTCFKVVLSWVGICSILYGWITFMPIFRHDSPYYTSLSPLVWRSLIGVGYVVSKVLGLLLYCTVYCRRSAEWFLDFAENHYGLFVQGMQKAVEATALDSPSEIDARAIMWTFYRLDEDHELEQFFSGLTGFRSSKFVKDPLPSLTWWQKENLGDALIGLLDRTFTYDLLPAPVKKRRTILCAKAIEPAHNINSFRIISRILSHYQYQGPVVAEVLQIARGWHNDRGNSANTSLRVQATVSSVVARAQERDGPWFILTSDELGVSKSVLRDYEMHGDSLSLAILIHIIHQQFGFFWNALLVRLDFTEVLYAASKFNARDSLPELQHKFCALWNQVVHEAQNGESEMACDILKQIRNVYIALHEGTDCAPRRFSASTGDRDGILWHPSSYPLCNIPGHHPDSPTHIHDVDASSVFGPALHVDDNLRVMGIPLLDNNISVLESSYPCHQTTTESLPNPSASPDPATAAGGARDIDTMPPATIKTLTSPSSVHPNDTISPQNIPAFLVHSDVYHVPEIRFSASPEPTLDKILPTDSNFSISAETSPGGTSLWPTSERSDKDACDPPSVQANTMVVLDPPPPPELPSLTSNTDKAITGPSQREPDAEHAGDYPLHASRSQ